MRYIDPSPQKVVSATSNFRLKRLTITEKAIENTAEEPTALLPPHRKSWETEGEQLFIIKKQQNKGHILNNITK